MSDYEKIRKFLNENDHFCVQNGMVLTVVREGYAEAEVEIKDWMMNGLKVVQGGLLFTLCDFAFAGAANSYGKPCIAMCGNISFMRPDWEQSSRLLLKWSTAEEPPVSAMSPFTTTPAKLS